MVGVKPVGSDPDFQPELSGAGSRLAVVKFTMRGCGPCLRIAPAFSTMSNKYPQAVFLEVDVHQCQGTAATNNISATPTFLFFRNKVRIDQYQGADAVGLEEKIKQHLENDPGSNEDTDIPKGYMDLMPFINKAGCECLNESDEHGFDNCLRKDMTFLESDCDEQLLITVAFNQPVKLYSMKFQGPDNGQGPKYVKIFINLPRSMDFEEAERSEPTQALELTEDDIKEDGIVPLRYVKFQNVNSVTIFVQSNQGEEETTRISYFTFIGTPVQATNMNDFKRELPPGGQYASMERAPLSQKPGSWLVSTVRAAAVGEASPTLAAESEEGRRRVRNIDERDRSISCLLYAPYWGDQGHNPGMCPDQKLNHDFLVHRLTLND
ncbi:Thioredoxin-like protein 1 [Myotis davidii]|uniref:Thioredoxin-like protein 1 n=1 Tax=Myotis davidii TaxID=225400 RepID=L5LU87_MYODS|nr:Thioredoxin-like protein 1 [Myotis davidii]